MLDKETIIPKLQEALSSEQNIEFGYLFGSYADGTQSDRSDVDLALYLNDTNFNNQLDIHAKILRVVPTKEIDLIVLNTAKNLYLLDDIFKKGQVIKDSEERLDFEVRKEHQILDYKEFKKSIDAA